MVTELEKKHVLWFLRQKVKELKITGDEPVSFEVNPQYELHYVQKDNHDVWVNIVENFSEIFIEIEKEHAGMFEFDPISRIGNADIHDFDKSAPPDQIGFNSNSEYFTIHYYPSKEKNLYINAKNRPDSSRRFYLTDDGYLFREIGRSEGTIFFDPNTVAYKILLALVDYSHEPATKKEIAVAADTAESNVAVEINKIRTKVQSQFSGVVGKEFIESQKTNEGGYWIGKGYSIENRHTY